MKKLTCLMILTLCLPSCAGWQAENPPPGKAAAILDEAQEPATAHAKALTGDDLNEIRRSGLELITVVRCWVKECGAG